MTATTHPQHEHRCCHHAAAPDAHAHHAEAHGTDAGWAAAAQVTLHCLLGCAIGEWIGLALGVTLGLPPAFTMVLSITLAFASGFALTLLPMTRRGISLGQAFRIVWLGELTSIAVMEWAMTLVDYNMGGMSAGISLGHPQYWLAFFTASIAGYFAAWPVNLLLLRRHLKSCHAALEHG